MYTTSVKQLIITLNYNSYLVINLPIEITLNQNGIHIYIYIAKLKISPAGLRKLRLSLPKFPFFLLNKETSEKLPNKT